VKDEGLWFENFFWGFCRNVEEQRYRKNLNGEIEKLELANCRGIGFCNAATIAGVHGGAQRLLRNTLQWQSKIPAQITV